MLWFEWNVPFLFWLTAILKTAQVVQLDRVRTSEFIRIVSNIWKELNAVFQVKLQAWWSIWSI